MSADDLIVIRTFSDKFEAEVAKSALDAAEIASMIRSDDGGSVQPGLWLGRGVELLVREEDAKEADEILSADADVQ